MANCHHRGHVNIALKFAAQVNYSLVVISGVVVVTRQPKHKFEREVSCTNLSVIKLPRPAKQPAPSYTPVCSLPVPRLPTELCLP